LGWMGGTGWMGGMGSTGGMDRTGEWAGRASGQDGRDG
jgi:hypothetical protein